MSGLLFVNPRVILIYSTKLLRTSFVISIIHCRDIAFIIEFSDVVLLNDVPALYMMKYSYLEKL